MVGYSEFVDGHCAVGLGVGDTFEVPKFRRQFTGGVVDVSDFLAGDVARVVDKWRNSWLRMDRGECFFGEKWILF